MSGQTRRGDDARVRIDFAGLRRIGVRQVLLRFAAGAGASLLAALASHFAGPAPSGPLLALPAILIASLTLISGEDGTPTAIDDARGAVFGAVGLAGFAVIAALLLGQVPTWLALVAATLGWITLSLLGYGSHRILHTLRAKSKNSP